MGRYDIVVHSLAQAVAALAAAREAGVTVRLVSAPAAAATLGALAFRDMIAAAEGGMSGSSAGAVLDCGDAPGLALNAMRHGIKVVRVEASPEVRRSLGDIAAQCGAALDEDRRDTLDLRDAVDARAEVRAWLEASQRKDTR